MLINFSIFLFSLINYQIINLITIYDLIEEILIILFHFSILEQINFYKHVTKFELIDPKIFCLYRPQVQLFFSLKKKKLFELRDRRNEKKCLNFPIGISVFIFFLNRRNDWFFPFFF